MANIGSYRPASNSLIHHAPLNQAIRSARFFLDGLTEDKPEEFAAAGGSRRIATLKSGGGKLTLLPGDELTVQDMRARLRIVTGNRSHIATLERKLKKLQSVPENPNSARDIECVTRQLEDLKALPFNEKDPLASAKEVKGFGKSDMVKARLYLATAGARLWLRENRVAGIPIVGALFVLKMTLGLWLLSQFDKAFNAHATSGHPLPQFLSFPGLQTTGKQDGGNTPQLLPSPQVNPPTNGYNLNYPAYQSFAPPVPNTYYQGYYQGSGL